MNFGEVHIYRARDQPATKYVDDNISEPGKRKHWVHNLDKALRWCGACRKRRWCSRLVVQVYYDGHRFYCKPGHGCKVTKQ